MPRLPPPRSRRRLKKLAEAVAEEQARHPGAVVETFATDEHRIGLKPILRRVRAPRGERPIAPCHHRFEWLWVLVDEPIVNKHFETLADLDATVAERCVALNKDRDLVKGPAGFHWWPE